MKKLLSLLILISLTTPAFATPCNIQEQVISEEQLFSDKSEECSKVIVTNQRNILCAGNIIKVAFDCPYHSDKSKAGDKITFSLLESLYTQEGTLIFPANTKFCATVIKIVKQRVPNKNARVYLKFDSIMFPEGGAYEFSAKPYTKDSSLKEGPWMTTGKLAASTVGLGAIGAGAGVGFAFIPNPAKIGTGLAIGIPIGASVGFILGLITPGLKYHAKAGEQIQVITCKDMAFPKQECCCKN